MLKMQVTAFSVITASGAVGNYPTNVSFSINAISSFEERISSLHIERLVNKIMLFSSLLSLLVQIVELSQVLFAVMTVDG